jgi:RimJ/RimL family protein N-acetyltransferase
VNPRYEGPETRIAIREPTLEDAPEIVAAVRESLEDLLPWMSWATREYGEPDAARWLELQRQARESGTEFGFLVTGDRGRLLGTCGINQLNPVHQFANLGYWVRSSESGRGIAVVAVRLVRDWVFANTGLRRLEIVVARGNRRSERVAEKAGAHREGVLRSRLLIGGDYHDATMYSLVRDE